MRIPDDWDRPSPDNNAICAKFTFGSFDHSGRLPYRLFVPKTDEKVPMVVYLHGADAFGDDNEQHLAIHDIGTVFARNAWQERHPCYVLAPQCSLRGHWSDPINGNRVCLLIEKLISEDPLIDPKRIYIYGYSAGGVGTLGIIKTHPGMFAAAMPICGATEADHTEELKSTPLWLIHAADDEIVRVSYGKPEETNHRGSRDLYDLLRDVHPHLHYTEYPAGYMKEHYGIHPHCSWVPAGENKEVKEWMFRHSI